MSLSDAQMIGYKFGWGCTSVTLIKHCRGLAGGLVQSFASSSTEGNLPRSVKPPAGATCLARFPKEWVGENCFVGVFVWHRRALAFGPGLGSLDAWRGL